MSVKTKEKAGKKRVVSFTLKQVIFACIIGISIFYLFLFYHFYGEKPSLAKEREVEETFAVEEQEVQFSTAKPIDIDHVLAENTQSVEKEEYIQEEAVLEYLTTYRTNPNVPKGVTYVVQEGRQGIQKITKRRVYQNGELIKEEQTAATVVKAALNQVVEIGGGAAKKQVQVKVGDTVYVTSDRLSVMTEANESADKIATLKVNDELKVLAISSHWYQISCGYVIGWVKQDCTTNRKWEEEKKEEQKQNTTNSSPSSGNDSSAGGTVAALSFSMKLNQPSGFSLERFQKVLTDQKDVNQVFQNNAEYFYYVEKQYNINGIFVAAVGIHESAWGTSKIAKDKKNLFGYGAYDANPYQGAYQFKEYSESIDLVSRVFVKYYLNPKGTSIYGGETAVGTYYSTPTLSGVNQKYATDKNWANRVYQIMQYLYGK